MQISHLQQQLELAISTLAPDEKIAVMDQQYTAQLGLLRQSIEDNDAITTPDEHSQLQKIAQQHRRLQRQLLQRLQALDDEMVSVNKIVGRIHRLERLQADIAHQFL